VGREACIGGGRIQRGTTTARVDKLLSDSVLLEVIVSVQRTAGTSQRDHYVMNISQL
jgi:hypothetical protein